MNEQATPHGSDARAPRPRDTGGGGALLPFREVIEAWRRDGGGSEAALDWTRSQVRAFRGLLERDGGWQELLQIFHQGRGMDSWLASDWPHGFDELLLCAPLCQLVGFECARCSIGARQGSFSCAHPATVFGRVGQLLQQQDRAGLLQHLEQVEAMLEPGSRLQWDFEHAAAAAPAD
jgi:hypothetical protein